MHEYWFETRRAELVSDTINYVILLHSVCSLLFSVDIPPSSSALLTLQSNPIHLDWWMRGLRSRCRLQTQMHGKLREQGVRILYISKTTFVVGLLVVLQTVDLNLITILQVCLRNRGLGVHTLAINHKSWAPSPTDASALKVLIHYPRTFQECLYNGATRSRRSHFERNVLCSTRPYDQLKYVVIVVICH
jgi:hypothetical protein